MLSTTNNNNRNNLARNLPPPPPAPHPVPLDQQHYLTGIAAYYEDEFNQHYAIAVVHFNIAITHNPNNWLAYYARALAYYHQDNYQRTIEDLTEVIHRRPLDSAAHAYRGLARHALHQYPQARVDFLQALNFHVHSLEDAATIHQALQYYQSYTPELCNQALATLRFFLDPLRRQPENNQL